MNECQIKEALQSGRTTLGIEFGSTRIKAVLADALGNPIASGNHDWENLFENGVWTYRIKDVWSGLHSCYRSLREDVLGKYGVNLKRIGAIGISAMMHGYLPFDSDGNQLAQFRTWRNTITGQAAEALTGLFNFNIPQRWSIAHLYQAILNHEEHVGNIAFLTTLAGYIHWKLTGQKVLGVGEASGMFPIDSATGTYNSAMLAAFDDEIAPNGFDWNIADILPRVLNAGDNAGSLTPEGAKLLDESGELEAGIPMCPPEGDAGTGMAATNSVAPRTGNVSAGTSVFAMVVLEKEISKVHPEIDMVTTPSGSPVAMVHCNNCTSDLNAWVSLFGEFAQVMGISADANALFGALYTKALEGDRDCGNLLAYNYYSGEHIVGLEEGRPLFVRTPDSKFTLANFMRTHLYAALGVLKTGMDILLHEEKVEIDQIFGHGGLFKTRRVGQSILAAAIDAPVSVMDTAGEGGAWGMALLAGYMKNRAEGERLESYLAERIFNGKTGEKLEPDPKDVAGFDKFMKRYTAGLAIEHEAVRCFR